ncbi:prenyltransferase/squalene oxidase repeat-containing protein [Pseudomonas tritici]
MTIYLTAFAGVALSTTGKRSQKVRRMADYLAAEQTLDGAWPYSEHVRQTDIDSTCLALECLQRVDPVRHALSIQRGRDYLASMANPDGGFSTYCRNHPSEATMTANVIIALAPAGPKYAGLLSSALAYLAAAQHADGTFERSWSLSATFAIARVTSAMHQAARYARADLAERVQSKSMTYLRRTQNPDGGWGQVSGQRSDVISSAHALSALSYLDNAQALRRAVSYLKRHRGKHARFQALPDQAAPRPIPYQFPVLAQIFVLNALGEVANTVTCASLHPPTDANGRSLPHGRGTAACSRSPREYRAP